MNFLKSIFIKQKPIETTLTITSSNGFHLRPIAQFANEAKKFKSNISIVAYAHEVSATQVNKILSLSLEKGESFILRCIGEDAKEASEHLTNFFNDLMNKDKRVENLIQEEESYESNTYNGISVSPGISIAPLFRYAITESSNHHAQTEDINSAIKLTQEELLAQYETHKEKEDALIFLAQKELLTSEIFSVNFSTIESFKNVINQEIKKLEGTKFESRISDYQDLKQKVLSYMGIGNTLNLPDTPYILLVDDLLPSEISKLYNSPIKGVVLKKGTPTSHASILLRSYAIPSVIIHHDIELAPQAILDTSSGDLVVNPNSNDLKKAEKKQKLFQEKKEKNYKHRFEATQTLRGKPIKVLANIGDIDSAKEAKELGADGVGLLRSEFLFSEKRPSIEEQTQAYVEILELFSELTIRTLDVGGDKALPYAPIEPEQNPFLGIRGIRFALKEKTLLEEQLLAIFKAVDSVTPNNKTVKIMFPMVSTCDEFIEAKWIGINIAKKYNIDISNIQFGIMLEIPSVIFALSEFDKLVDFYSIGTNDLTQYLFAVERTHPTLQVDASSPILMAALKTIIKRSKKPVSICGELAGLADVTEELINMGYDTLSVSAKLIPSLKARIRNV